MKPRTETSGVHPLRPGAYDRLREVLLRHASRITVDGMLSGACQRARLNPAALDAGGLEQLVQEISPAVRMFCKPDEVPSVMRELAKILG